MSIKEKIVRLLTAGVDIEAECDDCGTRFDERDGECPECGSTSFSEPAGGV